MPGWVPPEKPYATLGADTAPVTIVEYSDFQCPWCYRFAMEVKPALKPLLDSGQVQFVYKQFPVLGPDSLTTAQYAECAGAQGQFWPMHDWLFENQANWKGSGQLEELLLEQATTLGLDAQQITTCLGSDATQQAIAADYAETQQYGFQGTPSFVINGRLLPGFLPLETFKLVIDAALAEAQSQPLPAGVEPQPTPDIMFEDESYAVQGAADAPVTIYEFSDYQCPFCLRFFEETKPLLDENYIETGQVRFVYKDFPLDSIHPQARSAARAAECAGEQGSYWPMHDRLFGARGQWADQLDAVVMYQRFATDLALDTNAFSQCLDSERFADEIQSDLEEGLRAGVQGTPTFFINGKVLVGAQPYDAFVAILEGELQQ
jgi:protein-disulfide isomerase